MAGRSLVRDEVVLTSDTWVIKVGTNVLARSDGALDEARVSALAEQICGIAATGRRVALVSSGAVGAGVGQLGLRRRPDNLSAVQAAAAVGQAFLIRAYDESFRRHGRHAAQLLLTHEDFESRTRYLNMRNTLLALFGFNAVPIINENDTISVDELRVGDNDHLAAMVANLLHAKLLVLLSVVEGLCQSDPAAGGGGGGEVIPLVPILDEEVMSKAGPGRSALGSGGMRSKLEAARMVTRAGGLGDYRIGIGGEYFGADFGWGRGGDVVFGAGASEDGAAALDWPERAAAGAFHGGRRSGAWLWRRGGKSLLAVGIVGLAGAFVKGDVVSIRDARGVEFARGLTNYSTSEAQQIIGQRNDEVRRRLGTAYEEVIHRDNLVLVDE